VADAFRDGGPFVRVPDGNVVITPEDPPFT
jgi:hypothetical protein